MNQHPNTEEQQRKEFLESLTLRQIQFQTRREEAIAAGLPALKRVLAVARRDTGQSQVCGRFLLSLYNGPAFPFDLTDLRRLDVELHDDCLAVLRLDASPEKEVHKYFVDGDRIWDELKVAWTTERDLRAWGQAGFYPTFTDTFE
jgi:hypothetical protein